MKAIISAGRTDCGVTASPEEIAHNPYLLAEMYCGESADDRIPWSTVDRGVLPSPDLGGEPLAGMEGNDERRFRDELHTEVHLGSMTGEPLNHR
jgi:hypothetical protein